MIFELAELPLGTTVTLSNNLYWFLNSFTIKQIISRAQQFNKSQYCSMESSLEQSISEVPPLTSFAVFIKMIIIDILDLVHVKRCFITSYWNSCSKLFVALRQLLKRLRLTPNQMTSLSLSEHFRFFQRFQRNQNQLARLCSAVYSGELIDFSY